MVIAIVFKTESCRSVLLGTGYIPSSIFKINQIILQILLTLVELTGFRSDLQTQLNR